MRRAEVPRLWRTLRPVSHLDWKRPSAKGVRGWRMRKPGEGEEEEGNCERVPAEQAEWARKHGRSLKKERKR